MTEARKYVAEYIRKLETSAPTSPGMYLRLIHGRKQPDEELEDWGPNGPYIGPLRWCHITYLSSINICAMDDENGGTGPMFTGDPMYLDNQYIVYNGMYYGDFELELV